MKNGYVTEHHLGDNGTVSEGMILKDMTIKRFEELEKRGLVREATAAEVEKGYTPPFHPELQPVAGDTKQQPAPADKKAPEPSNKGA